MLIQTESKSAVVSESYWSIQSSPASEKLKITLPTGRIQEKVLQLLEQVGLKFLSSGRSYRPVCSDKYIEAKTLKAQNIPALVALGRHDCGFTGYDWIIEQNADIVELLDLGFDPVRIVAAIPEEFVSLSSLAQTITERPLVVASEYRNLANIFIKQSGLNAIFVQAYGATEALPPEDADIVIDNTSSGTTLHHNRLLIVDELMQSTTRFICNKQALEDPAKRARLEELTMLMKSTIEARTKVLLEMNFSIEDFNNLASDLPCMLAPTVSPLYKNKGYVIKIAVPSSDVPRLIPRLVSMGARDILEYKLQKIIV